MVKEKIHHLIVMQNGSFKGILSATDVIKAYLDS